MHDSKFNSILNFYHSFACGGHYRPKKTCKKVSDFDFYWPILFHDAYMFCKNFEQCPKTKKGNITHRNEMP